MHRVEAGVESFYLNFQPSPEKIALIRGAIRAELANQREQTAYDAEVAVRRTHGLKDERRQLLHAHYQGAVPLDLLEEEMQRLTREMADAERAVRTASLTLSELDETLEQALKVVGSCGSWYLAATPKTRRQMNQGFFKKLLIGQDGSVERMELSEPFAAILGSVVQDAPDASVQQGEGETREDAPASPRDDLGAFGRARPSVALAGNQRDVVMAGVKGPLLRPLHLQPVITSPSASPCLRPSDGPSPCVRCSWTVRPCRQCGVRRPV